MRKSIAFVALLLLPNSAFGGMVGIDDRHGGPLEEAELMGDYITPLMYPYYNADGQTTFGYSVRRIADHEIRHALGQGHSTDPAHYTVGTTGGFLGPQIPGIITNICYSFVPMGTQSPWGSMTSLADLFGGEGEEEVREAFRAISEIANIDFWELTDLGTSLGQPFPQADIRIGAAPLDRYLAFAIYPNGPLGNNGLFAGDIVFNTNVSRWVTGVSPLNMSPGDLSFLADQYGLRAVPEARSLTMLASAMCIGIAVLHRRKRRSIVTG